MDVTPSTQGDPAIDMLRRLIEALTRQKAPGTPPFAPMSLGLQSFDTVMPLPTTNLDNAREMLRRAGLI